MIDDDAIDLDILSHTAPDEALEAAAGRDNGGSPVALTPYTRTAVADICC